MKSSPLHLKNYFVTHLSVRANQLADLSQGQDSGGSLTTKVENAKHAEDERQWRVAIQISCSATEKKFCPYLIEAELVGFFEADKSISDDKVEDIVAANAPALLYSAARELVLLVTGRGPFPPFCLPSATFIDHTPSSRKALAESKAPVPA